MNSSCGEQRGADAISVGGDVADSPKKKIEAAVDDDLVAWDGDEPSAEQRSWYNACGWVDFVEGNLKRKGYL